MDTSGGFTWWKHGVIYQIYPRSFYDSNGDGVGDLPGVIEKLDYLARLGVDAVWLSPVNTSPMHDFGYDISDFRGIDPLFGTLDDCDRLIAEAHRRNIRIIMDLVINHTSHLHPWFIESRSSRENPKRDWYIWHDGKKGKPPNNWMAAFGGRAWEWDDTTGQYYFHSFLKEQPDLNWRNAEMRRAVFDDVRFWLDRGVDGFRLDAVIWYVKDALFRSNPFGWGPNAPRPYDLQRHVYDQNRPETHDVLKEFRKVLDEYDDRMSVGETYEASPGGARTSASYLGNGRDELHLAFDFSLLFSKYGARRFRDRLARWYAAMPPQGWPCLVLNNHDQPRSTTRWCRGRDGDKKARVLAALLLTAWGTPFLYYGEEIGMKNGRISRRQIRDPVGKKYWPFNRGRDPERTPMQWSAEENAGFSTAEPWIPVADTYRSVNVLDQEKDPGSVLSWYRTLIKLRRERPALHRGSLRFIGDDPDVLAYLREQDGEKIFVALNFSGKMKDIAMEESSWRVLCGTDERREKDHQGNSTALKPYEVLLMEKVRN
ncbi:MAG TPA: alpha-glucosidase [Spirochaetota bacterium]|nr:alpha-glucosidase [Spirochaetota bacterium]HPC40217.1 alpha-glucosidase [Spirochaetota bacterium]HPL16197.1 alpha-glucosidase [Spirochaetota bacterium]HQF07309.1 alpha-glucosidase [Spirochaetota bacterium]HQH96210.1 alpha-glucosidase [Spirochaetota bacterium]